MMFNIDSTSNLLFINLFFVFMTSFTIHSTEGRATSHTDLRSSSPTRETRSIGASDPTCGNPQYAAIKERLLDNYDPFVEFCRLSPFSESCSLQQYNRSIETAYVENAAMDCAYLQAMANVKGGETCPGRYELNIDSNRVPCIIREFKCTCKFCAMPDSLRTRHQNPKCEPIYHYVPVMRRTLGTGTGSDGWSYMLEPVVGGCTCNAQPQQVHSARY